MSESSREHSHLGNWRLPQLIFILEGSFIKFPSHAWLHPTQSTSKHQEVIAGFGDSDRWSGRPHVGKFSAGDKSNMMAVTWPLHQPGLAAAAAHSRGLTAVTLPQPWDEHLLFFHTWPQCPLLILSVVTLPTMCHRQQRQVRPGEAKGLPAVLAGVRREGERGPVLPLGPLEE